MANTIFTTFGSRDVSDLKILDFATMAPILEVDYANTSALEMTGETIFAYGGQGHPKRIAFYGERAGTFTMETQISSMQLYKILSGGTLGTTGRYVEVETITASAGGTITMTGTALDGTVPSVYADATGLTAKIAGSWSSKVFTATTAGDIVSGTKYNVYYIKQLTGVQSINIKASNFPTAVAIYANAPVQTEGGVVENYKMVVYKAAPQNNFSISQANSGDPVTLTVTFDLLADSDNNMLDLILEEPAE